MKLHILYASSHNNLGVVSIIITDSYNDNLIYHTKFPVRVRELIPTIRALGTLDERGLQELYETSSLEFLRHAAHAFINNLQNALYMRQFNVH